MVDRNCHPEIGIILVLKLISVNLSESSNTMTSLEKQLNNLRTAVSGQLGVERPHVSLLFDKKDAGSLYVENALQIGQIIFTYFSKFQFQVDRKVQEI